MEIMSNKLGSFNMGVERELIYCNKTNHCRVSAGTTTSSTGFGSSSNA
ncbi:hypothetical protein COLO4_36126 [Corchorus olitorius]|uniref:Uncharacterized protein n=1 Tax=Corchorus olitorius TaxID=93759 RepID=A0A1R3GAY1_9ROSI|nr:hypothetical protein COLO4_36126 [Corchorus olitorius]